MRSRPRSNSRQPDATRPASEDPAPTRSIPPAQTAPAQDRTPPRSQPRRRPRLHHASAVWRHRSGTRLVERGAIIRGAYALNPRAILSKSPSRRLAASRATTARLSGAEIAARACSGCGNRYSRAYSSAARDSNSNATQRSSPTTHASCPGMISYAFPGPSSSSVPSSCTTCIVPD